MILDETSANVFLVPFTTGTVSWSVRVKHKQGQIVVLSATSQDGQTKNGREWKDLLARTGQTEDFWGLVDRRCLVCSGVPIGLA